MAQEEVYYRPPSEADSFIIRLMHGCPHNACTFCNMFKDIPFRVLPLAEVLLGLERDAAAIAPQHHHLLTSMYFEGGDPLAIDNEYLLTVMNHARSLFPALRRFACYATARFTIKKSQADLDALGRAGLKRVFVGLESGSAALLKSLRKGCTPDDLALAGRMLHKAGIEMDVSMMLGIGGQEHSRQHALSTAALLNDLCPACVRIRTFVVKTNTELGDAYLSGRFVPMGPHDVLRELRLLVENIHSPMQLLSEHWTNFIDCNAMMPEDKAQLLERIDAHLQIPESGFRAVGMDDARS